MAESTVRVVFLGDASKLKRELDGLDDTTAKAESGFSRMGKAVAGATAVAAAVSFGKGAFDAAIESQKVGKQTEAVIKSMGLASTVTADKIGDMASALSKKNGVDDEAIQTGQNLLLTFGNLAKTAGTTGGAFERASQIMVDMGAAMGTDASSSAIQLGKALNDPANGISALTRVGVSFTEQQKEQIKAMQEAGDIAGAQTVILGELERQFGGSAEAQATATDRMAVAMGNLQEEIGARLIPVVEALSAFVVETVIPAFGSFVGALKRVVSFFTDHWEVTVALVAAGLTALTVYIVTVTIPALIAKAAAWWAVAAATIAANAPIIAITALIAALVAGVIYAYRNFDWFRESVDAVASFLTGTLWPAFKRVASFISDTVSPVVVEVAERIVWFGRTVAAVFADIVGTLAGWVLSVWQFGGMVLDFFRDLPGRIWDFFGGLADTITSPFREAFNAIARLWNNTVGKLSFKVPSWVPGIGGNGWSVPKIPEFHEGGIVPGTGEQLALLKGGEGVFTRQQMKALGGGGVNLTINVNGGLGGPERIGAATADAVRRELAVLLRGAVA